MFGYLYRYKVVITMGSKKDPLTLDAREKLAKAFAIHLRQRGTLKSSRHVAYNQWVYVLDHKERLLALVENQVAGFCPKGCLVSVGRLT